MLLQIDVDDRAGLASIGGLASLGGLRHMAGMKGKGRSGYQPGSGDLPGIGLTLHLLRDNNYKELREQICAREDVKAALARGQCVKIHYETGRFEILDEGAVAVGSSDRAAMAGFPGGTYEIIKPSPGKLAREVRAADKKIWHKTTIHPGVGGLVDPTKVLRQPAGVVDASNLPGYTGGMDTAAAFAAAARTFSDRELKEYVEKGELAAAVLQEREGTTHATATPRLKWDRDRLPDENPATFAWRAYAAEAKAGTLHRGVIGQEDKALAVKLSNWLRTHDMPEGIDIPTKPEWNERQLAKLGEPPRPARIRTDQTRLYEAARYRATRA
jgi:hypothetical protein